MKNESVVGRLRASASRQKPKVLRVSLAAGLTSALWCGAPRPAQAEWSMRYEWTGTTGAIGQSFPWELPDSEWTRDSQGFMTPYEGADGVKVMYSGDCVSASLNGTITAVFTWEGTAPVPDKLYVKIVTRADAGAWGEVPSDEPEVTASAQASASSSVGTKSGNSGPPNDRFAWANGIKLIQRPTKGQREVRVDAVLNAQGSVTISPADKQGYGYARAELFCAASGDTRSATVSRGIAAKQEDDPTLDKSGDEWIDAKGTGHGHTTYSYLKVNPWNFVYPFINMPIPGGDTAIMFNPQTFIATANNFADPTYNWDTGELTRSNTAEYPFLPNSVTAKVPFGTQAKVVAGIGDFWAGPATGQNTYTITCKVADSDGAEAEANYELTAHDQYENFRRNSNNPSDQMTYQFPAGPASGNIWLHPIPQDPESNTGTATWNSTYTGSLELSGSIGGTITGGTIIASAGINWTAGAAVGLSVGQEFGIEAPVRGGMMRYAMLIGTYERKNYLYDEFSPSGKVKNSARPDGAWEFGFGDPTTVTPPRRAFSVEYAYGDWDGNQIPDGEQKR